MLGPFVKDLFFFSSRRRHTRSVSAFLLNRSSEFTENIINGVERMPHDLSHLGFLAGQIGRLITISTTPRSEERFSKNAETDIVCRLLLEKKKVSEAMCTSGNDTRSHTVYIASR